MQRDVIDLFCGAGGLSQGFRLAGCTISHAVERDRWAAATFRTNFPDSCLVPKDIRRVDQSEVWSGWRKERKPFAIIGGPPCQGFSEANRRTRTVDNKQNYLYREFFRIVRAVEPQWFVLENVAGLRTLANGTFLKSIIRAATRAGYKATHFELNAADYGVPQFRRRLFIIGSRDFSAPDPPRPTHGQGLVPHVSVRNAIGDLPVLRIGNATDYKRYKTSIEAAGPYQRSMRENSTCPMVQGNLVTMSNKAVIDRYRAVRQGRNWESISSDLFYNYKDVTRCHTGIYYRLPWDKPSRVIGNFRKNMLIHPSQHRGLSVREAARLQSFQDSFVFCGSIGFQQQQVADAVPPLLARTVAAALIGASSGTLLPQLVC